MKSNLEVVLDSQEDLTPDEVVELDKAGKENGVQRAFMKHSKRSLQSFRI